MSRYRDWKVGMKVVCIASAEVIAKDMRRFPQANYPFHNGIYTIREVFVRHDGVVCVYLHEVDNRHLIGKPGYEGTFCYREPASPARLFKPVETRKTDISIFTAMLNGKHQNAPEYEEVPFQ